MSLIIFFLLHLNMMLFFIKFILVIGIIFIDALNMMKISINLFVKSSLFSNFDNNKMLFLNLINYFLDNVFSYLYYIYNFISQINL